MAIDSNQVYSDTKFVATGEFGLYRNVVKRLLDILIVLVLAVPAAIVLAFFALVIALVGQKPFYRQARVGKNGQVFQMLKLRSMIPNAEENLREYLERNPEARKEWDLNQKLRKDPRITRIGAFIRKTSVDELPQIWNVLVGDMSIVGPRPMMCEQQSLYPGKAYFAMLPGITGFWQVSRRNDSSFAERAYYDVSYYQDLSLATDLRVLLKTVIVVIRGTGY
ncbi:MAG: sugar transferase [Rhodobacteraceae bacterium]|nr:sugar transferase [Paracoccaceae bacterium]